MDLKVVKHNLKELRYAKGLLKKYKSFLVSGRYYLFPSKRAISLNDEKILNQAKVYFTKDIKSSKTTWIISKLNKTDFFSVNSYMESFLTVIIITPIYYWVIRGKTIFCALSCMCEIDFPKSQYH